ncbi:hypothetical protein R2F61_07055 [Mollicutes bacterium LVI A0078]|nr:hypothetical protein RZE84_07060 [Mollicutes bacterium LVI A0075]WOO90482.1 hypothetical protein R2F61_07055 [Mollicutes bacterium LVI A0078]
MQETMNIKELNDFYQKHYEDIQKASALDKLMYNDKFVELSESNQMSFLNMAYNKFVKTDYYSIVDDHYYDYIETELLDVYISKDLIPEYNPTNKQIQAFIEENKSEVSENIFEHDYDDFFNGMGKDWIWEETQDLKMSDFDTTKLSKEAREELKQVLAEEELIHVTASGEILSGDYDDYNNFKWNLMDDCLEEIIKGTHASDNQEIDFEMVKSHVIWLMEEYDKEELLDTSKIAVMSGNYNFSVVNKSEVTTELKSTTFFVEIDNNKYNIQKAITFEGSQEIDRLMDTKTEYPINEYRITAPHLESELDL